MAVFSGASPNWVTWLSTRWSPPDVIRTSEAVDEEDDLAPPLSFANVSRFLAGTGWMMAVPPGPGRMPSRKQNQALRGSVQYRFFSISSKGLGGLGHSVPLASVTLTGLLPAYA